MKILLGILLITTMACSSKPEKTKVEKSIFSFVTTEGINHPESALYSPVHKTIFVSNIMNGNPLEKERVSYISRLSPEGKVENAQWVKGLRAPKGLAVVGDHLFVSDINELVKIHIPTGKVVMTFQAPKAKFLNDVAADDAGNIYVSDMNDTVIYRLMNNNLKVWLNDKRLRSPNGLFNDGQGHLIVSLWGGPVNPQTYMADVPGGLLRIPFDLKDQSWKEGKSIGHLDGLTRDSSGNLWISDWMNGDIYRLAHVGPAEKRLNFGKGTADISYSAELGVLLVPQMLENKVMAIRID